MQIQIDGQGITVTPALRELTIKKLERALFSVERIQHVHITFKLDNTTNQVASANVAVPGTTIHAHASSNDMYKTVDLLMDNLLSQMKKYKEKTTHHRN